MHRKRAHIPSWSGAMSAPRRSVRLLAQIGPRVGIREEPGFTLIEVLVAMVVLLVGLLALVGILDGALRASASTRAREGATNLGREIIEDARTIPYAQIVPTSIESQLQGMSGLADASSASGWQIERRGFVYTVSVKECALDDPKDGLAKTHGSTFCEAQQEWKEGIAVDAEPEDLKRITVEVSWTIQKHTSAVKQVSTLTAAGQAIGLIATKLELTAPVKGTTPVIGPEYAATTALTFSVSFPEGTSAIDWSLEGTEQEEIAVSSKATSTTFSWTINESAKKIYVSDGTYKISAQTVNSTGVIGPPISISVRLIRGTPAAPEKLVGGFKHVYKSGTETEVAELQWKADSERDVIGYRVWSSEKLICPESAEALSTATSCIDFTASGKPAERTYTVVALYINQLEKVTESPKAATITVKQTESTAPSVPTELVATKNADGSVTLKWKPPTSSSAPVSFYRIYRGSKEYTSRYGVTYATECSAKECSFTDAEAATTHEYWVTAASENLVESTFPVPVTG
jgi:prepilin-type N-terminal cleavage/methylation domain-containing protein